jgi:hypothetical protein
MTEHNRASIETGALPAVLAEQRASEEPVRAQKGGSGWAFFLGLGVVELVWLLLLVYVLYRLFR